MSFEFTVLPDERFIEILEAWVDSPWPKTTEDGYALRDRFGWVPAEDKPSLFTSDVRPDELSSSFSVSGGNIRSMRVPITDIAPEEARGESLADALVIYRHFWLFAFKGVGGVGIRRSGGGSVGGSFGG